MGCYPIGAECCNNCVHWRCHAERKIRGNPPKEVYTDSNCDNCSLTGRSTLSKDTCNMFRHMGGVTKTFALEATPTGGGANGWIDSMDEPGRAFAQSLMEFSRGSSSSQIPETSAISLEQEDDDDVSLGDEFVRSMTELGKANDRALELVKEGMAREFQFKDKAVEFMHLLDRAKGGDAEAQFAFARAFWSGTHGCAKEDEENSNKEDSGWGKCGNGWHWCNESADNGYCWAQLKKGVSKRNDAVESGSVEDHEKAIMWLDKALHHSEVRDKDREKAGVYSRALNNSRITLGKKYLTGKDVTPDFETAMSYFEAVAESGDSRGVELKDGAENLRNGLLANLADLKKRAAAESGGALNELGMIYGAYSEFAQYQLVAKKDDHKSAEYFKKAAECHSLDGMDNLGNCYKKGRGVEKGY